MKTQSKIIFLAVVIITALFFYTYIQKDNSTNISITSYPSSQDWQQYFDEKFLSLRQNIISSMPPNWESQLPYTIYNGQILGNPEHEIAIKIDFMINKEDALKVGKEGQKKFLIDIYNQIRKWIAANYSSNQPYRLYLRIFIPNQDACIAMIWKTSSLLDAPIDVQFGEIFF